MFYSWFDREQNVNLIDSTKRCDCKFCELEHENLQISSFFGQRIDRKLEQKQQYSSREELSITHLSTLDYNLKQQLRKRQQQEKLKQRRKFVGQDNNFSNNLQKFISLYKNSE
ncbi:hypothetical protein RclHR1_01360033 [Rhizophagus clarus]|uniref:Uncharacterized protein n=1 Tax=Rhizophagus clarus TaxID=94130 RepID=A0A2Z6QEY2_9GLOM|nr:hypothetical protein RclHR1_01360033 [Rhizophagus clarus]GES92885.1 hypothetical protein GLOIN_2v1761749 [Rhizophagus clarus]